MDLHLRGGIQNLPFNYYFLLDYQTYWKKDKLNSSLETEGLGATFGATLES